MLTRICDYGVVIFKIYRGDLVTEIAMRLIKEAVIRAVLKHPRDIEFYRNQMNDPSCNADYRQAMGEAIEEVRKLLGERKKPLR